MSIVHIERKNGDKSQMINQRKTDDNLLIKQGAVLWIFVYGSLAGTMQFATY